MHRNISLPTSLSLSLSLSLFLSTLSLSPNISTLDPDFPFLFPVDPTLLLPLIPPQIHGAIPLFKICSSIHSHSLVAGIGRVSGLVFQSCVNWPCLLFRYPKLVLLLPYLIINQLGKIVHFLPYMTPVVTHGQERWTIAQLATFQIVSR